MTVTLPAGEVPWEKTANNCVPFVRESVFRKVMQLQRKSVPLLLQGRKNQVGQEGRKAEGQGGLRSKAASETFQSVESVCQCIVLWGSLL